MSASPQRASLPGRPDSSSSELTEQEGRESTDEMALRLVAYDCAEKRVEEDDPEELAWRLADWKSPADVRLPYWEEYLRACQRLGYVYLPPKLEHQFTTWYWERIEELLREQHGLVVYLVDEEVHEWGVRRLGES